MSNSTAPTTTPANAASATKGAQDNNAAASTVNVNSRPPPQFPPPKTDKPRPHVCGTCSRSFARLEHLKRHERSHTKEKPFECPECTRCFARRDLLLRHQQKLHASSTPSSRPRNRRESASGAAPTQSRARKNSIATPNPANAANNGASNTMRPRANTISHVDGAAMMQIAAANAAVPRPVPTTNHSHHSRHTSLMGLPMHGMNDGGYGGMAAAMGQRNNQHALPKLETNQLGHTDFSGGLRTAPLSFNPTFPAFDDISFGSATTINPNALRLDQTPTWPMSMGPQSPNAFMTPMTEYGTLQTEDTAFDWLTSLDQINIGANENVIDGSSPSAISTTSQSGISDLMVDGSNHPTVGTSSMWQSPSLMGPPHLPNAFSMDLGSNGLPDLFNGVPCSPQPANQKMHDPYSSTPPPSMSSASPSVPFGFNSMHQALGLGATPDTPTSFAGNNGASPVSTITDGTRAAIVNALSHCLPFGGRKYSFNSQTSPQSPHFPQMGATPHPIVNSLPSTADLQRYVGSYLAYFHPHLPFLHLPTLSFDVSRSASGRYDSVNGSGCLILSMSAIGALYEGEQPRSQELFEMAKKMILYYLEERRKADVRKADHRRASVSDIGSQAHDSPVHTPVWLVQAMLLNVVYGHNCGDKTASDIASTHCTALVSLAHAADLVRQIRVNPSEKQDVTMTDWGNAWIKSESEAQREWIQWKTMEERKRTLYTVFVLSSLLVSAYNHTPALTNSEILLDLPCDEEFYAAESAAAFVAKGGVEGANHNRMPFHDALGDLLRSHAKKTQGQDPNAPLTELRPSTFGCLVLINALHNYIWETRQRHHNKVWTNDETETMHRYIEPALKAWQAAWASNPQHSLERPNPTGSGPLSADAIPLLDLAYVRLYVNLSRSKELFWQRDWNALADELARGTEIVQHAEHSPASNSGSTATEPSERSAQSAGPAESPLTQASSIDMDKLKEPADGLRKNGKDISKREKHLRKAAFYAADSLSMSHELGITFADFTSRELPLQSAMCAFDCAQVLAEWIATVQDRIGRHVGILGQDVIDFQTAPAILLFEEEDVKLLNKIREVLSSAESKINLDVMGGDMAGAESVVSPDGHKGYAAKILRVTALMLEKSAVWPVTNLMAQCLYAHADHSKTRAERSKQSE